VHPTWSNTLRRDETGRLVRGQVNPSVIRRKLEREENEKYRSQTARSSRTRAYHQQRDSSRYDGQMDRMSAMGPNISYGEPDNWMTQKQTYTIPTWHKPAAGFDYKPQQPCDPHAPQSTSFPLSRAAPAPMPPWTKTVDPNNRQCLHVGKQPYFASAAFKRHHIPGYGGHLQTGQFEFGRSSGRISRDVLLYQNGRPKAGYKNLIP